MSLSLRRDCANSNVLKWNGTAWTCEADNNSTYTAGNGVDLNGSKFSVEESHRLPQNCASGEAVVRNSATGGGAATWNCDQFAQADQACASGQFASGVTAVGTLSCAAPSSSGGIQAFSTTTGPVTLAGRTSVLSKTLPAGKYLLFASVELINQDLDSKSTASCDMPGYGTRSHDVDEGADAESLFLSAAITHAGGSILLACTETTADVDVDSATLSAIKFDSIG